MRYDFDAPLNRVGSGSVKWAKGALRYGKAGAMPMLVADMDFAVPQPVVETVSFPVETCYSFQRSDRHMGADATFIDAIRLPRFCRQSEEPIGFQPNHQVGRCSS